MLSLELEKPQLSWIEGETFLQFAKRIIDFLRKTYPNEEEVTPLVVLAPARIITPLVHLGVFALDGVRAAVTDEEKV